MSRWRSREEDAARPQGVRRNVYGGNRKGREGWTSSWGLLGPCDGSQDGVGRKGDGRGEGWLNGRRDGRRTGLEDDMMARGARGRRRRAVGSVPRLISAGWNSSHGNGTPPQLLLGGGVGLGGSRDARGRVLLRVVVIDIESRISSNNLAAWIYRSVWPRRCHGPCRVIVKPSSPAAASSAAARSPSVCPSGRDRRPVEAMMTAGPRQLGRRSSADAEDEVDDGRPDGDTRAPRTEVDRGDAICCCYLTTARVDKERSWRSISPRRRRQRRQKTKKKLVTALGRLEPSRGRRWRKRERRL
uniref:Uncharacterized protein n=1 Tax=Oryza rufipogon TaxID=4529 RepID=A0A0E0QP33_ORYRU